MANEIWHNYETGKTLYFCAFQLNGDVFLTGGASDEVWGTGGRDADDYDETMTESGSSGHYVGAFDTSIAAGVYRVTVFLQDGVNPADTDRPVAQGEIYWDGSAEINLSTIVGADGDTLKSLSDQLDGLAGSAYRKTNVYGPGE